MAAALKLISHKLCPYVQRAVIALNEKGVAFERVDIDLASKPDWFLKLSPLGKVPVLTVGSADGEVALFESNVICEYIEETQGGARLHPQDPLQRAQHRAWMPSAYFIEIAHPTSRTPAVTSATQASDGDIRRYAASFKRCASWRTRNARSSSA